MTPARLGEIRAGIAGYGRENGLCAGLTVGHIQDLLTAYDGLIRRVQEFERTDLTAAPVQETPTKRKETP